MFLPGQRFSSFLGELGLGRFFNVFLAFSLRFSLCFASKPFESITFGNRFSVFDSGGLERVFSCFFVAANCPNGGLQKKPGENLAKPRPKR